MIDYTGSNSRTWSSSELANRVLVHENILLIPIRLYGTNFRFYPTEICGSLQFTAFLESEFAREAYNRCEGVYESRENRASAISIEVISVTCNMARRDKRPSDLFQE